MHYSSSHHQLNKIKFLVLRNLNIGLLDVQAHLEITSKKISRTNDIWNKYFTSLSKTYCKNL